MAIESATFLSQLVTANPGGGDAKSEGDNHIRLLKTVLQNTFPGVGAAVSFGGWHAKADALDTKTGNYTLVAGDDGKALYFNLSGAATLTLLAAATAGNGYVVFVVKGPTLDLLTIDGASAETVNGQATITVGPNEGGILLCNGTSWQFIGLSSLFTGERSIKRTENNANAQAGVKLIRERTGAVVANDLGVTIEAQHKDSASNVDVVGRIGWAMSNITNGAESMAWYLENIIAGAIATADRWWKGQGWYADGLLDPGQGKLNAKELQQNNAPIMPRGYIDGLILSNNGTDASNDIDISAGVAVDDGAAVMMKLSATLTKRLDAAWAVGSGNGGLDTGAEATSTWYHVWLIRRPDTGVVDALFSLSATAPTMPTNYTQKHRLGAVFNDSGSVLRPFMQRGNQFWWKTPPALDVSVTNLGTSRTLYTLSVPTGVVVEAIFNMALADAAVQVVYFTCPDVDDVAPSSTVSPLGTAQNVAAHGHQGDAGLLRVLTNTSAQIGARSTAANTDLDIATLGWIDPRGQNA